MRGVRAEGNGCSQLPGADGQQQGLTLQRYGPQILERRQQGGRALEGGALQAQQPLPPASTSRHELAAHLARKRMTGVHHNRIGPAAGGGGHQFGLHGRLTTKGADPKAQRRMGPVGQGCRRTDHAHRHLPAEGKQALGQLRAFAGAGHQPQASATLVHVGSVHQDGRRPMIAGE